MPPSSPSAVHFLSAVSLWEIQIKLQLGKLVLHASLPELLAEQRAQNGLQVVTLDLADILGLADLPPLHRDPFDRMLIAQARTRGFTLVSGDQEFARYDVPLLW